MGADMFIATAAAPTAEVDSGMPEQVGDWRQVVAAVAKARAQAIPEQVLVDALTRTGYDFVGNEEVIDADREDAVVTAEMIHAAREALSRFGTTRMRDVCCITIGGREYLATGGLSWGDTPTDSYDLILLLDEVDFWGKPITADEIATAIALGAQ